MKVVLLRADSLEMLAAEAVDQVRRGEGYRLRGQARGQRLKKTRWLLLKSRARVRGKARKRLDAVIHSKLQTARAWCLKEAFTHFWTFNHPRWAKAFLDAWITRTLRSRSTISSRLASLVR